MMDTTAVTHAEVIAALAGRRFSLEDEKQTQVEIAAALAGAGVPYRREVRLHAAPEIEIDRGELIERGFGRDLGVIDFMVGTLGVEVKIKGAAASIVRQLRRYAESYQVGALLLVTNRAAVLPPAIDGKPLAVFHLGRAWL
ncbi:MAG: hypothetical protein ACOYLQ_09605 [Hyphomicrobiaceae bacterium]